MVALQTGQQKPAASAYFAVDPLAIESGEHMKPVVPDARYVPAPLIDTVDPGARAVSAGLAIPDPARRISALQMACTQFPKSREAKLRLAAAHGESGSYEAADKLFEEVSSDDPWEWRVLWLRGRMRLAQGDTEGARKDFDQVYFDLPGELAPKLALGFAAERTGHLQLARRMYDLVSRVDENMVSASFGLARCAIAMKERSAAVDALARVPQTSSVCIRARVQTVAALIANLKSPPLAEDLAHAAGVIEGLAIDMFFRGELRSRTLRTALDLIRHRQLNGNTNVSLFGARLRERELRLTLERTLRAMAQLASGEQRIQYVDEANAVRPRSLV